MNLISLPPQCCIALKTSHLSQARYEVNTATMLTRSLEPSLILLLVDLTFKLCVKLNLWTILWYVVYTIKFDPGIVNTISLYIILVVLICHVCVTVNVTMVAPCNTAWLIIII